MATPGTFISTAGHIGLLGWLIVGWGMNAEPFRIETMDVTVISGEEFDQMRAARTPVPGLAPPTAPAVPAVNEAPPPTPAEEPLPEPAPPPEPVTPPESETPPPAPPEPVEAEVVDTQPPAPPAPEAPPPLPDLPESDTPTPPRAPTVASTLNEPPAPDARVDDVVREEVVPDDSAEAEVVAEEQEATAPEETTTQIVPEDLAPTTSIRPSARPARPAPPTQTETAEAPDPQTQTQTNDDVAAALESALSEPQAPSLSAGPPLTGSERDGFRVSVQRCWNVGGMSSAAQRVVLTVSFELDRNRRVIGNQIQLLSASGGDQAAIDVAFRTARSAIFQCQTRDGGFNLPADKYDSWREVELTFDPSEMRQR